jgi:hypothetical protein
VGTPGIAVQLTDTLPGALVKLAAAEGLTVITLDDVIVLLHGSVNVQVSVMVPPQNPGAAVWVEITDPLIKQFPVPLFV